MFTEENIIKRYRETRERLMPVYEMMKQNNHAQAEEFYRETFLGLEEVKEFELSQAYEGRKEIDDMERKLMAALIQREEVWQQMGAAIERGDGDMIENLGETHKHDNLKLIADAGRSVGQLRAELAGL